MHVCKTVASVNMTLCVTLTGCLFNLCFINMEKGEIVLRLNVNAPIVALHADLFIYAAAVKLIF